MDKIKNGQNYNKILRIFTYIMLAVGSIMFIFPIFWAFLSSFKPLGEIEGYPPTFFPENPTLGNYRLAFVERGFLVYIRNSLFIAIFKTAMILYTSAIAGYVFGKIKFPGRNKIFIGILLTMMIPWPVFIIPLYDLMQTFGWYNNYLSLFIPFFFDSFGIFLIKQFVVSIPDEVIESAKIDGANQFTIFHRIIIPHIGPALSALGIFTFLWVWDDYIWPNLMLADNRMYTVPIGLSLFVGDWWTETGGYLAASSITIIPIIIVFIFAQKRFIEGVTFTGIK